VPRQTTHLSKEKYFMKLRGKQRWQHKNTKKKVLKKYWNTVQEER
jgi:hypothetical protein